MKPTVVHVHTKSNFVNFPASYVSSLRTSLGAQLPSTVFKLQWLKTADSRPCVAFVGWRNGYSSLEGTLEISSSLAKSLDLPDGIRLEVSEIPNVAVSRMVTVEPLSSDDWEVIELNANYVEENLLRQVDVLTYGKPFPFWIRQSQLIHLQLVSTSSQPFVRLGLQSEVVVVPKPRKMRDDSKSPVDISSNAATPSLKPHLKSCVLRIQASPLSINDCMHHLQDSAHHHSPVYDVQSSCCVYVSPCTLTALVLASGALAVVRVPRKSTVMSSTNPSPLNSRTSESENAESKQLSRTGSEGKKWVTVVARVVAACECAPKHILIPSLLRHQHGLVPFTSVRLYPAHESLAVRNTTPIMNLSLRYVHFLLTAPSPSLSPAAESAGVLTSNNMSPPHPSSLNQLFGVSSEVDSVITPSADSSSFSSSSSGSATPPLAPHKQAIVWAFRRWLLQQTTASSSSSSSASPLSPPFSADESSVALTNGAVVCLHVPVDWPEEEKSLTGAVIEREGLLARTPSQPLCFELEFNTSNENSGENQTERKNAPAVRLSTATTYYTLSSESVIAAPERNSASQSAAASPSSSFSAFIRSFSVCDDVAVRLPLWDPLVGHAAVHGLITPFPALPFESPSVSISCDSLGALDSVIHEAQTHLTALLCPRLNAMRVEQLHTPPPGNLLIYGPAGSGKTALAFALARHFQARPDILAHCVYIPCAELVGLSLLVFRSRLEMYVEIAAKYAPSLLIFDDIHTLMPAVGGGGDAASATAGNVRELRSMQICEVFVDVWTEMRHRFNSVPLACVAFSSSASAFHSALQMSGMFTSLLSIPSPDATGRQDIVKKLLQARRDCVGSDQVDYNWIAEKTEGYIGADLRQLVQRALHAAAIRVSSFSASNHRAIEVSSADFEVAISGFVPTSLQNLPLQSSQTSWADIGGLESVKQVIKETLELPSKFARLFANVPLKLRSGECARCFYARKYLFIFLTRI